MWLGNSRSLLESGWPSTATLIVALLLGFADSTSVPLMPVMALESLRQVAACLVHLQQTFFPSSGQVTIVMLRPLEAGDVLDELLGLTAPRLVVQAENVMAGTARLNPNNFLNDLFVVVVGNVSTGSEAIGAPMRSVLQALPRFAATAVVVVLMGAGANSSAEAAVVSALWQRRLVNALLLVAGTDEQGEAVVTALSFQGYAPCYEVGPVERVGVWSRGRWHALGGVRGPTSLFRHNITLRLDDCVVRVAAATAPFGVLVPDGNIDAVDGVTIKALREMARILGFRIRPQTSRDGVEWGRSFDNGTGTGMLGDVMSGEADIAAGDWMPLGRRYEHLDMSLSTTWVCLTWALPSRAGLYPSLYRNLVHEFSPDLWKGVVLAVVVSSLATWMLAALSPVRFARKKRSARYHYLMAGVPAAVLIGVPRPRLPPQPALRTFLASWFMFSLVMTTAYFAALRRLLDDPWEAAEVDTLQGILDSGLDAVMHPNMLSSLEEQADENATIAKLTKLAKTVAVEKMAVDLLAQRRAATFSFDAALRYYAEQMRRTSSSRSAILHVMSDYCLKMLPISPVAMHKGSPLTPFVDTYLERMRQNGLLLHWTSEYDLDAMQRGRQRRGLGQNDDPVQLRTEHLTSVFLVLAVGLHLALVLFLVELLVFRCKHRMDAVLNRVLHCQNRPLPKFNDNRWY